MVDFNKRLGGGESGKPLNPIEIYDTLDRAHDKGPLRPAQEEILRDWHEHRRDERELMVKLHTGQGKTLIGLLMLQSKLNEEPGSAVYLCPNIYLINQTCEQAKQFGIDVCMAEPDLPFDFHEGKAILVTSVQKLFNGLTKFGLGQQAIPVGSLVMDDSHACADAIRDAFTIHLERSHPAYDQIVGLFGAALQNQGAGTFEDIRNGVADEILPVPYWEWRDKHLDVARILARHTDTSAVKFVWPILKDLLSDCLCVVGGNRLEIAPHLPPLELFGSYYRARHRVFMSATVTDDSFLVRGLRLSPATIRNPIVYSKERWSGEKMVLIPSLLHESLDRSVIVKAFGTPGSRKYGIVALAPSFAGTGDWEKYGAVIAKKDTIDTEITKLRNGERDNALVIVNRYDGIDLPDSMCRILIFDSKPYSQNLTDLYAERCRAASEVTVTRIARTIEQGLGRSVRGEKDYCIMILIGPELIKTVRNRDTRCHLSSQTQTQIAIGLEIAEMGKEDLAAGKKPFEVLIDLVMQCLRRDEGWKKFYVEKMAAVTPGAAGGKALDMFQMELEAELAYQAGQPQQAAEILQQLVDKFVTDDADRGWYLQEIARFADARSRTDSNEYQLHAHRKNRFLLKPRDGMQVDRIVVVSQRRVANIIEWVCRFENFAGLQIAVEDLLSRLSFGVGADRFEQAVHELGGALGFSCQRPDKEWKEGPDNLWGVRDGHYLLIECKSEVDLSRMEINKGESGQINNASAWFARNYPGAASTNIMIIPTNKLSRAAGFNEHVQIMRAKELSKLVNSVRKFFGEFKSLDLKDLSEQKVQELLNAHGLHVESLLTDYCVPVKSFAES